MEKVNIKTGAVEILETKRDWIKPHHIDLLDSLQDVLVDIYAQCVDCSDHDFNNLIGQLGIFNSDLQEHIDTLFDVLDEVR